MRQELVPLILQKQWEMLISLNTMPNSAEHYPPNKRMQSDKMLLARSQHFAADAKR